MKKLYVYVSTRLVIEMEDDVEIDEVLQDMDYNFTSTMDEAKITDTEIQDWHIHDMP